MSAADIAVFAIEESENNFLKNLTILEKYIFEQLSIFWEITLKFV